MPSLLVNSKKESVFILEVGPAELEEEEVRITPIKATITYRDVKTNESSVSQVFFEILLKRQDFGDIVQNNDTLLNYYRVKAAEALKDAGQLGDRGDINEARVLLQECAEVIKTANLHENDLANLLVNDLESVQSKFQSHEIYNHVGKHEITKKSKGHYQQRGEAIEAYQNCYQSDMILESKKFFSKHS
jgi:hypothetical protein